MRSPRFRRVPCMRDVALDPGRATEPRIAAPHILPSTCLTVSAPATLRISWLNPTPHMLVVYASPWSSPPTPQHSLPGGRYSLPGPDFHRLERASFPGAPDTSSPPCLPRLLPAGASCRVGLSPTGKRRLGTAHGLARTLLPFAATVANDRCCQKRPQCIRPVGRPHTRKSGRFRLVNSGASNPG